MKIKKYELKPGDKCIGYARYSGGELQGQKDRSAKNQIMEIEEYCKENGLILFKTYSDAGVSGTSVAGREQFDDMIEDLSGELRTIVKGVIVWSFSRFARNIDDAQYFKAFIRRLGYSIISLSEPVENSSVGRLYEFMNDWENQRLSEKISNDVKRSLHLDFTIYKALPGFPPKGFKRVQVENFPPRKDGTVVCRYRWEPDERYEEAIRNAFVMKSEGKSNKEILENIDGLCKRYNSLTDLFRNPIYYGKMVYGGIENEEYCRPIISKEIWEKANSDFVNSRQKHMRKAEKAFDDHLFSGIIFCGKCGRKMWCNRIQTDKTEYVYSSYRCPNDDIPQVKAVTVDNAIILGIVNNILSKRNIETMLSKYHAVQNQFISRLLPEKQRLQRKYEVLENRMQKLFDYLEDNGKSDQLTERIKKTEEELNDTKAQMKQVEEDEGVGNLPSDQDLLNIYETMRIALTDDKYPLHLKRKLMLSIIQKIVYNDDKTLEVYYSIPTFYEEKLVVSEAPPMRFELMF